MKHATHPEPDFFYARKSGKPTEAGCSYDVSEISIRDMRVIGSLDPVTVHRISDIEIYMTGMSSCPGVGKVFIDLIDSMARTRWGNETGFITWEMQDVLDNGICLRVDEIIADENYTGGTRSAIFADMAAMICTMGALVVERGEFDIVMNFESKSEYPLRAMGVIVRDGSFGWAHVTDDEKMETIPLVAAETTGLTVDDFLSSIRGEARRILMETGGGGGWDADLMRTVEPRVVKTMRDIVSTILANPAQMSAGEFFADFMFAFAFPNGRNLGSMVQETERMEGFKFIESMWGNEHFRNDFERRMQMHEQKFFEIHGDIEVKKNISASAMQI